MNRQKKLSLLTECDTALCLPPVEALHCKPFLSPNLMLWHITDPLEKIGGDCCRGEGWSWLRERRSTERFRAKWGQRRKREGRVGRWRWDRRWEASSLLNLTFFLLLTSKNLLVRVNYCLLLICAALLCCCSLSTNSLPPGIVVPPYFWTF